MAGSGGPWGGGGGNRGDDNGEDDRPKGGRRPGKDGPQIPEIEEIMKKGPLDLLQLICLDLYPTLCAVVAFRRANRCNYPQVKNCRCALTSSLK